MLNGIHHVAMELHTIKCVITVEQLSDVYLTNVKTLHLSPAALFSLILLLHFGSYFKVSLSCV